jgi:hypothetical protein
MTTEFIPTTTAENRALSRRDQMNKLTITIERIDNDYYSYVAEGGPSFGELRGCQNAEAIKRMIPIDVQSWIASMQGGINR